MTWLTLLPHCNPLVAAYVWLPTYVMSCMQPVRELDADALPTKRNQPPCSWVIDGMQLSGARYIIVYSLRMTYRLLPRSVLSPRQHCAASCSNARIPTYLGTCSQLLQGPKLAAWGGNRGYLLRNFSPSTHVLRANRPDAGYTERIYPWLVRALPLRPVKRPAEG